MPLVLYLPPHHGAASPSLTRRLRVAALAWLASVCLDTRILRDEARLAEMDERFLADVGLTRRKVARGALRQWRDDRTNP